MIFRISFVIFTLFLKDLSCIKLLYTNPVSFCLVTFNPSYGNQTTQFLGGNFNDVSSFDFYRDENVIYWSDNIGEVVKRYQKTNSSQEVDEVLSNLEVAPEYLAVDWIGEKLYWIGSERNTIEVSNLDGSYRKVLLWEDVIEAQSIVLHPKKRFLFWTDCGHYPRIGRSGMDGSERIVIAKMDTCVFWPNSLSIDYSQDRLYFSDERNGRLFSYLIDGTGLEEISPKGLAHPSHVSISNDFIFWINWKNSSIYFCPKDDCQESKFLTSTGTTPKDFKVIQPERNMIDHDNPCLVNNGGCSHLCLLSPSQPGYSCACPVGIKMTSDGKSCSSGPSEILLVVRQVDLRWVSLDTPDLTNFVIPLPQVRHAVDVTFDPIHGMVYWSDVELQSITGAYLNGSGLEVVINSTTIRPEGVALDWRGRNLFWIDSGKDRIQVIQLDGLFDKVIIDTELMEPRAIVIDPMKGYWRWN